MTGFLDGVACLFLKCLAGALHLMPFETALAFGRFLGRCFFYFSKRRRVAYADLKAAFGARFSEHERWKIVRKHYQNHGQMLVEILYFPKLTRETIEGNVDVPNLQGFLKLVEEGRGVVLITAHYGNWELLQIISGLLGKPVNVLARDQKFKKLDQYLNKLRETHGSVAIKRGMGIRELFKSLKRGELIGVLGDQDAGRDQGLIMNFLGRKTTVPTGAFELASRTNSPVLPCFMHRVKGAKHQIYVGEPIECAEAKDGDERILKEKVSTYVRELEKHIEKNPEEWLWETKRWKYTWTKRILILSDGKPGHIKQSEAVAACFAKIKTQYGRPGMEYPTETVQIEFKSGLHRKLFAGFTSIMMPFAQGRVNLLRFFLTKDSFERVLNVSADFVISAGSSLVPLNLYLAKDFRAKSVVLMKPSFPYNFYKYDLVIVPLHDQGIIPKREFRTLLTPSYMEKDLMENDLKSFETELRDANAVKVAVFLGGSTKHFVMDHTIAEKVFSVVKKLANEIGDYVITTSRRTPETVSRFLKKSIAIDPGCQMLVIANEDSRREIAGGMMALADTLIVTEDSVSMVSEAVNSGKNVIVLNLESKKISEKHRRFMTLLSQRGHIQYIQVKDLEENLRKTNRIKGPNVYEQETEAMQNQLQEIL